MDCKRHWTAGVTLVTEAIPEMAKQVGLVLDEWIISDPIADSDMESPRTMVWHLSTKDADPITNLHFCMVLSFTYLELHFLSREKIYEQVLQDLREALERRTKDEKD
jgi:hypothetical protein